MGMHLLTDKDGNSIWINNSVDTYGCSREFPSEQIAQCYMDWAMCNFSETRKYKYCNSVDEIIEIGNRFMKLISICSVCKKDLEPDDIDNRLYDLKPKKSDWYDFNMKCEDCIEKEAE